MRILYTIMAYGPNIIASEVHSELGREFRAVGHSFSVLSVDDYKAEGESGASLFDNEQGHVQLYTVKYQNKLWHKLGHKIASRFFKYAFFIELVLGLAKFLRQHAAKFDVAHVEAAYPLGAAWTIAQWLSGTRIPTVLNLQGADVMSLPTYDYGYARYWLPRQLLRLAFRACRGVRANSEQTAALALALGAHPNRLQVIYRNISDQIYPASNLDLAIYRSKCQQVLRQKYNLSSDPIVIAYSRLHPFKGLDFLIQAVPELRTIYPQINLLICGPNRATPQFGDYRAYLEKLTTSLDVNSNVVFTGKIDFAHSAEYLAGADVLVIPSIVEALNKVAIEAAAVGTPSVITDTTGIAVPATQANVAVSVAASNPSALAQGICQILKSPLQYAENGPNWSKNFSSAAIAGQLLEFYNKLIRINKRLCYVAYPSSLTLKSANAIQTFSTCRELKRLDPQTLILIPRLLGRPSQFAAIGAQHLPRIPFNFFNNFKLLKPIAWSYLERTVFSFETGVYLLFNKRNIGTIYVRDVICAYWLLKFWQPLLGIKVIYEVHDLESRNPSRAKSVGLRRWLQTVDQVVNGQSDILVSLTGTFRDFVLAEGLREVARPIKIIPDAYDDTVYSPLLATERLQARAKLGFEDEEFLIVYSGLTFAYRSLDKLVAAFANFLKAYPQAKAKLVFAGGRAFEQAEIVAQAVKLGIAERVTCVGQQPPERVNLYLNAASLLAIPDTVTDLTASPLKLFEYAAVARPILLPDLAALKEILTEEQAVYFERGNTGAMQAALEWVYNHPNDALERGHAARLAVEKYTYANRAATILSLLAEF